MILLKPSLKGFFQLTALRPDGRRRPLTGWFPNLITDVGLNAIGTKSYLNACHVGTGNTTPAVNDTVLAGFVAGTTTRQATAFGAQSTEPYYGWKTITYRFAQGAAAGNLAEIGVATAATNGGSTILFSRALILNELGVPTTVTVLSDEVLDATYQIRLYPPLVDTVQNNVAITGSGTHTVTTRARAVTNGWWGELLGSAISFRPFGQEDTVGVHNGDIGTILTGPSGVKSGRTPSLAAYGDNSLLRDATAAWGLPYGNLDGGIRSASFSTTLGLYQTRFDPIIDKTNTKTLSLTFRVAWTRNV